MAYINTVDERYGGTIISGSAGSRDAPGVLNNLFALAEGQIGYGALIPDQFYNADLDVYHLGLLTTGTYSIDVNGSNWDFYNSYYAGVSSFGVVDQTGFDIVPASYTEYTDLTFTLTTNTDVYAYVQGGTFTGQEYSIQYNLISVDNLPSYSAGFLFQIDSDTDARPDVGDVVNFSNIIVDLDGFKIGPVTYWYLYDPASNTLEEVQPDGTTYTFANADVGKFLTVNTQYIDNNDVYYGDHWSSLQVLVEQPDTSSPQHSNTAPSILSLPITSIDQESQYQYVIEAYDPDPNTSYSYEAANLPSWLQFDTSNGTLTGLPSNVDIGVHMLP